MKNAARPWQVADIPVQEGHRFIITGANSGIGYEAALKLARKKASVVLACRNQQRGEEALTRLNHEAPGAEIELALLDLASLESVRRFAGAELERSRPLHVLVNNAGVYSPPRREETVDGFELQFGINVLGHFALTGLLLPALAATAEREGAETRVVTVASIAHKPARLNFDDLQSVVTYSPGEAYGQSKLADLMFALELGRRLRAAGWPVSSVAVHPGVADTNLFKSEIHSALGRMARGWAGEIIGVFLNTGAEGALPTLYAATCAEACNGGYYGPQGWMEMRGDHVGPAKIAVQADDEAAARRLWNECEGMTGVRYLD